MVAKHGKNKARHSLRDFDFERPRLQLEDTTKRWIAIVSFITFGLLSLLSLLDAAGTLGVYLNVSLRYLFGLTRWLVPVCLMVVAYVLLRPARYRLRVASVVGAVLLVLGMNSVVHLLLYSTQLWPSARQGLGGGYVGALLAIPTYRLLGYWASLLVLLAGTLIGLLLVLNQLFARARPEAEPETESEPDQDQDFEEEEHRTIFGSIRNFFGAYSIRRLQARKERALRQSSENQQTLHAPDLAEELGFTQRPVAAAAEQDESAESEEDSQAIDEQDTADQLVEHMPARKRVVKRFKQVAIDIPLHLLSGTVGIPNGGDLKANALIIKKTLAQFGIRVEMGESSVGPTVTQYTLKPAEGVRLSKIISLHDNLALALAAHPIRIEAPVPGKSIVGLEVPNQSTAIVPLRHVLDSEEFRKRTSNMMMVLGEDVMGKPWFSDLTRMPHLLIAGATGSGKSVCINTIIVSLLYQNGPGMVKFIMVDPKRVELPVYNGIPHLLTPVITDVKKTINALRWAIAEMERRFELLSGAGKRNIQSYNESTNEPLPFIVIVIDELADLMAASAAEVEGAIIRLAQMSRAVGIHLILATQRPSVDVITGLIKANIPARIAFSVASLVDSRTILDGSGAEKLLGRGDMLYLSAELGKPKRLQGAYASDEDIKNVIEYLKKQAEPEYLEEVVDRQNGSGMSGWGSDQDGDDGDPLLEEAKEVVFRAKKASASLLQRRLRVGYARAARLLDLLEQRGLIGPGEGAKPRDVLVDRFSFSRPSQTVGPAEDSQDLNDEAEGEEADSEQEDDMEDASDDQSTEEAVPEDEQDLRSR